MAAIVPTLHQLVYQEYNIRCDAMRCDSSLQLTTNYQAGVQPRARQLAVGGPLDDVQCYKKTDAIYTYKRIQATHGTKLALNHLGRN